MRVHLKPLAEQVIVITGASSGIGLATAREAVKRGAAVVLAARIRRSRRVRSSAPSATAALMRRPPVGRARGR